MGMSRSHRAAAMFELFACRQFEGANFDADELANPFDLDIVEWIEVARLDVIKVLLGSGRNVPPPSGSVGQMRDKVIV
jgi:hypothetical protein